ncbi:hypothetical protein LEP1GSC021_2023 [Leptospira noguchii str. 1993005606]|uniref:Uncharacterized protein n=3 Tax=Leptospira noguchii TaxID=28182 RepID=M6XZZ1_9LEPT|nr:hypothetical protein LEP1GSC041_1504 [Leptospira noguchii str. 2006001870]EMN00056.1 hypothetical protein LEP1GSC035_3646 [Leptospira noguchii str. 2007001578]EMO24861.1 hypothetical protein LEP1GSC170_3431 [Leptospira interrogans serovar Bataviae str. HAI135]EMO40024.1 hypothetical protein LEP1GSC186_1339 [Leptospira noguchii serovar Autumnalis str. ZUN142]EMO87000.1 hypothetical protein LEP1GSC024_0463 [Leptospira noguchii str. 2001034031]EPE86416.1 hypothetical protein LEP1GSC021_2023 [L
MFEFKLKFIRIVEKIANLRLTKRLYQFVLMEKRKNTNFSTNLFY